MSFKVQIKKNKGKGRYTTVDTFRSEADARQLIKKIESQENRPDSARIVTHTGKEIMASYMSGSGKSSGYLSRKSKEFF